MLLSILTASCYPQGDGNIRYYEISTEKPYLSYLMEFRSPAPQKGLGKDCGAAICRTGEVLTCTPHPFTQSPNFKASVSGQMRTTGVATFSCPCSQPITHGLAWPSLPSISCRVQAVSSSSAVDGETRPTMGHTWQEVVPWL